MLTLSSILACLALLGAPRPACADLSATVPLEHPVYSFLERCEARGLLPGLRDGVRPFSRRQVAAALVRVDTAGGAPALPRIAQRHLERYMQEFAGDVRAAGGDTSSTTSSGFRVRRPQAGRPLVSLCSNQGCVQGDLLFRHRMDSFSGMDRDRNEHVLRSSVGATIRGQVANAVGFWSSFLQTMEYGTRTYQIRDDVYQTRLEIPQLKESHADYHEGQAAMVAALPVGSVELGKGVVSWGPGLGDNLGLSDNAPGFAMVRLRLEFPALSFVAIHGKLRPCPARPKAPVCWGTADSSRSYVVGGVSRTLESEKYLAAHRLEFSPAGWLDIGLQEAVVYGDRGPELVYLNPVMFYYAAQSYLGDKDNVMMGLDADLHPGHGIRAYVAYVIDDLKKLKVLSDDYTNKFSFQVGVLWVDPPGMPDADLHAEYVRIEPWIYTHKYPINTFRHFDMPLGHALGPNSDRWQLRATRRMRWGLALDVHLSRTRHGDNVLLDDGTIVNVGGDLHLGRRAGDWCATKEFLDGNLIRRTEAGVDVRWRRWPNLTVSCGAAYQWGDNVPLPPHWDLDPTVALIQRTGYGDADQMHLEFDLRYGLF